jgi:MFS family permease
MKSMPRVPRKHGREDGALMANKSRPPIVPPTDESSLQQGQPSSLVPPEKESSLKPGGRLRAALRLGWVTRDVSLLIGARTFMSAARALAGVVVPIYLALIGFSGLQLGVLFVVVALTSAILSTTVGVLSDRIGRKLFLIALPLLAAVSSFAFAGTQAVVPIFIFASLGSFGRGAGAGAGIIGPYQPAEQAWLADAVPSRTRNALFGWVAFASSLGALIGGGPLVALVQLLRQQDLAGTADLTTYRLEFLVMGGLALAAGLLAVPIADKRPTRVPPALRPPEASRRFFWPRLRLSRETRSVLGRLWITNGVNGLAVGFFGPFITYWFYQRYGAGPAMIGLLYSLINLTTMVSNLGAARIAARLGLVRAIVSSRALQAILMLPMVLAPTFWLAGACYLLRMLAQRVALPLRQSYVMGVLPAEERGTAGALSNLPMQATSAASPALAGYLFDHIALALPFEIGAFLQGVNALLFWMFFRQLLPPEERAQPPRPTANAD